MGRVAKRTPSRPLSRPARLWIRNLRTKPPSGPHVVASRNRGPFFGGHCSNSPIIWDLCWGRLTFRKPVASINKGLYPGVLTRKVQHKGHRLGKTIWASPRAQLIGVPVAVLLDMFLSYLGLEGVLPDMRSSRDAGS